MFGRHALKSGPGRLTGTAGLQLRLTAASPLIQGLLNRQSRRAQTLPTASLGTKMRLLWSITARTDREGHNCVQGGTVESLPKTWGYTTLDQSCLPGLCWHLVNMGIASHMAEQCHPSHCCALRHMPSMRLQECLSHSREPNNQPALFSTERHGHRKMPFWASCSGFNQHLQKSSEAGPPQGPQALTTGLGDILSGASLACFIFSHSFFLFTCPPQPKLLLCPCWHAGLLLSPRGSGAFLYTCASITEEGSSVAGVGGHCAWGVSENPQTICGLGN